jgi:hypothetical protein
VLIDIHVHTSRYSACGRSTPEEMVERAREVGLHGLVFTEHNVIWPADELASLQRRYPDVKLFRGVEVNPVDSDDYLVYGLTDPAAFLPCHDPVRLLRSVHSRGGAVILAHPYRYGPTVPRHLEEHPVDGIEVFSNNILSYAHSQAQALCARLGAWPTAASDAHHTEALGFYALDFPRAIADESELAQALLRQEGRIRVERGWVAAANVRLVERFAEVRRLIAQGYDDVSIRDQVAGVSLAVVHGLREGWDVLRPG